MLLVKGCQTLVMVPTRLLQQSLVNTVPHTIMVHQYLLWSRRELILQTKIWPNFFTTHTIDVWHVPSVHVACEGLSDLGHGHNQPTATIIGEYSASYHHGTLILTLIRARIDHPDQNLA